MIILDTIFYLLVAITGIIAVSSEDSTPVGKVLAAFLITLSIIHLFQLYYIS